jgi:hypothetical protein
MIDKLVPENDGLECTFDDEGNPQISHFANALSMWHACQTGGGVSVPQAMVAFNATNEVIRSACDYHPWLCIYGDMIEADGL